MNVCMRVRPGGMVATINKGPFLNAHPAMTYQTYQAAVAQAGWRNGIMPHQLLCFGFEPYCHISSSIMTQGQNKHSPHSPLFCLFNLSCTASTEIV